MTELERFESIARRAHTCTDAAPAPELAVPDLHTFETRNIHPDLPAKVRKLYDDAYYPESTFLAFKFVEKEVKRISQLRRISGNALMMAAFNEPAPVVSLNAMATYSDKDEQFGYRYISQALSRVYALHEGVRPT